MVASIREHKFKWINISASVGIGLTTPPPQLGIYWQLMATGKVNFLWFWIFKNTFHHLNGLSHEFSIHILLFLWDPYSFITGLYINNAICLLAYTVCIIVCLIMAFSYVHRTYFYHIYLHIISFCLLSCSLISFLSPGNSSFMHLFILCELMSFIRIVHRSIYRIPGALERCHRCPINGWAFTGHSFSVLEPVMSLYSHGSPLEQEASLTKGDCKAVL